MEDPTTLTFNRDEITALRELVADYEKALDDEDEGKEAASALLAKLDALATASPTGSRVCRQCADLIAADLFALRDGEENPTARAFWSAAAGHVKAKYGTIR